MAKGKLFVVAGPSGAGKTSVVMQVLSRMTDINLGRVVTYTSRPPRDNETPDKDYVFVSREAFEKKKDEGFFLETNKYEGNWYGSPMPPDDEMELGKSFIIILDLEGAKSVSKLVRDAFLIWVAPPDLKALKNRLEKRGSESASQLENRVEKAKEELEEAHKSRLFDFVLVNDNFEQSVAEMMALVKKGLE